MTDESVNYDIQQVQHDIERLQRDLARLQNDTPSSSNISGYEQAVPYDPLRAEEAVAHAPIMSTPIVYENQDWAPTPISTTSMIDEEIARAELEQALIIATESLADAKGVNTLTNLNMENMNMNDPLGRSQKIRNAIAALLAAVSTLIAAEAGAVGRGENTQSYTIEKNINQWTYS